MFKRIYYILQRKYTKQISGLLDADSVTHVRTFDSIPKLPQLPVLGNWHLYKFGVYDGSKYHKVLQLIYESYGSIVLERIGWRKPIIHVFDPDDAKIIYKNEDKMPYLFPLMETTHITRKDIEYMNPGFGHTNGEDWYRLVYNVRKVMMRPKSMQEYLPVMTDTIQNAIEDIKSDKNQNCTVHKLKTVFGKYYLKSASEVLFDKKLHHFYDSGEHIYDEIIHANYIAFHVNRILKFSLPFFQYWSTPKASKQARNEKFIYNIVKKHLHDTIEVINEKKKYKTLKDGEFSFLVNLLETDALTKEDLMAISVSLFTDGLYTIIPILTNSLYALAVNQGVQDVLYDEIRSISNGQKSITKDMLNDLVYLKAVIKETFRMYPNGTEIARINKKPLILSGYYIPPESNLSINTLVHHRSEKYFTEPNVFKPERWIRNEYDVNVHPFLLQPFGIGARTCTGRKFAELVLYTALFNIVRTFHLQCPKEQPELELVFDTLLTSTNETIIQFSRRN